MSDDHFAACRRRHVGKDLFEGLPFHVDVGSCISHRHVQPRVTEPLTDRGDVDAGLEKVNGGRVSKRVGVDPLVRQSRRFLDGQLDVFSQKIPNAEPG